MDHKAWRWRKKSSEKTIITSEEAILSAIETEDKSCATEKTLELQRLLTDLNEKLSLALSESNAKDEVVAKHAKVAEEAIAGWEKAEAEAILSKQQLEDALSMRMAAEERLLHLDSALKECMQQLRFVREEQEQRIHDAIMKASKDFDKVRLNLEEKLSEMNKQLSKSTLENGQFTKALKIKEKLIEDLSKKNAQAEADLNAMKDRLESSEKLNSLLKYELHVLEKELEIRNEEKNFNHKMAESSRKQHLESVKKINKLENECQRLRLLVRKRLPGPAALAKMKSEVEILDRDVAESRRKKLNPAVAVSGDNKMINFLVERLSTTEEENKILKESLSKKNNELQSSRPIQTASKLSRFESKIGDSLKNQTGLDLRKATGPTSSESTLISISEDDEVSCAESWASALMSELENFHIGKQKAQPSSKGIAVPDISLMDDFIEMEKLAIISVEEQFGKSCSSDGSNKSLLPLEAYSKGHPLEAMGKELVPFEGELGSSKEAFSKGHPWEAMGKELVPFDGELASSKTSQSWLQDILLVISNQSCATQRSNDEILEEVRVALANMNRTFSSDVTEARKDNLTCQSDRLTWRNVDPSLTKDSFDAADSSNMSLAEISSQTFTSDFGKSISKIVELIEGAGKQQLCSQLSGCSTDYLVRVFQWKGSELSGTLHNFIYICNELMTGTANVEKFIRELAATLEWIMNHCFSLQDVSSMKDSIKKHLEWDEYHSESEFEVEDCKDISPLMDKRSEVKLEKENKRLKDVFASMEFERKVLEERLQMAISKEETFITQLEEYRQNVTNLLEDLAVLKESKRLLEDQMENQKLLNTDLDTQLTLAKVELKESRQEFSSMEAELEDKSNCCHELEATCLELQLQLESMANKATSENGVVKDAKQLRTDWEITAASEKLAECQETILNLGRQLKALASPHDVDIFDKVVTTTGTTRTNCRSSLLDQMVAEDDAKAELVSPKTKEIICTGNSLGPKNPNAGLLYGKTIQMNHDSRNLEGQGIKSSSSNENKEKAEVADGTLAIVPRKQKTGGGFLRKLLMRRKRGENKKPVLAIAAH
ncbi:hypothetical protein H6P81_020021 [Aristolochia fimbriata]|uniref:Filament-like plant protein 7 n=1 Tax=Aristolochia fimbriata TaxID=158543 RepID=A0AAV7DWJ5_ARIFI|nr:hypothetical protein H6P81_020021 [Aristolochia fimbriata]